MKIENQVCSLEQAKRLEELGITSKSLFYWIPWKAIDFDGVFIGQECDKGFVHILNGEVETLGAGECFSAFTVAELGVMLPDDTRSYITDSAWCIYAPDSTRMRGFVFEDNKTEASIRAQYLIYLLEEKLITPEEVNKRLTEF